MSNKMDNWLQQGDQVALLVGGPEGLSQSLVEKCDGCWSLSAMTFAHPVVRVVLAEQVYRCFTILEGLPYHR
jgi:23S rRNA (pseudouridine1915-N3)-methyltransferase